VPPVPLPFAPTPLVPLPCRPAPLLGLVPLLVVSVLVESDTVEVLSVVPVLLPLHEISAIPAHRPITNSFFFIIYVLNKTPEILDGFN
jgi:hypothetical protein